MFIGLWWRSIQCYHRFIFCGHYWCVNKTKIWMDQSWEKSGGYNLFFKIIFLKLHTLISASFPFVEVSLKTVYWYAKNLTWYLSNVLHVRKYYSLDGFSFLKTRKKNSCSCWLCWILDLQDATFLKKCRSTLFGQHHFII